MKDEQRCSLLEMRPRHTLTPEGRCDPSSLEKEGAMAPKRQNEGDILNSNQLGSLLMPLVNFPLYLASD